MTSVPQDSPTTTAPACATPSPANSQGAKAQSHLARVRDNQRRSRARRKDYLQDLENKFRRCEQLGVEASSEMQQAARRVLDENVRLRQFLYSRGFSDEELEAVTGEAADLGVIASPLPQGSSPATELEELIGKRRSCCSAGDNPAPEACSSSATAANASPSAFGQPLAKASPASTTNGHPQVEAQPHDQSRLQPPPRRTLQQQQSYPNLPHEQRSYGSSAIPTPSMATNATTPSPTPDAIARAYNSFANNSAASQATNHHPFNPAMSYHPQYASSPYAWPQDSHPGMPSTFASAPGQTSEMYGDHVQSFLDPATGLQMASAGSVSNAPFYSDAFGLDYDGAVDLLPQQTQDQFLRFLNPDGNGQNLQHYKAQMQQHMHLGKDGGVRKPEWKIEEDETKDGFLGNGAYAASGAMRPGANHHGAGARF